MTVQHKSHFPKIMFLVAFGNPHTLPDGTEFNGKFGIWRFTENVKAARMSKNRRRDTMEIRGVNASDTLFYIIVIKRGGLLDSINHELRATNHLQITIRLNGATETLKN